MSAVYPAVPDVVTFYLPDLVAVLTSYLPSAPAVLTSEVRLYLHQMAAEFAKIRLQDPYHFPLIYQLALTVRPPLFLSNF